MPPADANPAPQKKPLPVAKLLPPKAPAPPPKPRPKPVPAADAGFEVVDDEDADTGTAKSAATETGFDVVDDDPPPKPKKKPKVAVEDDGVPKAGWGGDDADDDRPRKKKKKKRRDIAAADDDDPHAARERDNAVIDWGIPIFLMLLGFGMSVAGAVISGRKDPEHMVGVGVAIVVTLVFTVVMIPVTIVALMVIGGVMGIEYGTVLNAVRSLAAITMLVNGIYFLGDAFEFFGMFAAPAIASIATFALFMTLFKLDVFETWISLMGMNIIAFVGKSVFFLIILLMLMKGGGRSREVDVDPDDGPAFGVPGAGNQFNPGGGNGGGRNRRPFDPGDDDDN